jgi:putative PIN family toxin of toxin-antitoxin system
MLKNKPIRLVIDTNLWVSFIISKNLNQLELLLFSNRLRILFSVELLKELEMTMLKPKLKKYFSENALEEMLDVFDPFIDFIDVKSKIKICRDPKDDFLLASANDGKADYLLTGDDDLLEIGKIDKTIILKFRDFIEKAIIDKI